MQLEIPFTEPPAAGAAPASAGSIPTEPAAGPAGAATAGEPAAVADPASTADPADPAAVGEPGLLSGRPWRRRPAAPASVLDRLRPAAGGLPEPLLAVLAARGLAAPEDLTAHLGPDLADLPDPFLLPEMDEAARRVLVAAARGERVAVHGDFDVDGLTGSALLRELLLALRVPAAAAGAGGGRVVLEEVFVPDREADGYGLSPRALARWAEAGVGLVLTVDTGAAAGAEIAEAVRRGLQVVVLDHHPVAERPAGALAVVNSSEVAAGRGGRLCGAGVAFQLARALRALAPEALPERFEESVLDLAALGTIADQVPLAGENRILAALGLVRLAARQRPGLAALLAVSGVDDRRRPGAEDVAYQVAPRLNACGRIGRVGTALELLSCDEREKARRLAAEADRTNRQRREWDLDLLRQAVPLAEAELARGAPGLVLASEGWHQGIVGIGAARLVEMYRVPTVLIACEGDRARGSARSVPGLDVKAVLDRCAAHLDGHGGHAQAAGLSLAAERIAGFREAFLAALSRTPPPAPGPREWDVELPLAELKAGEVTELLEALEKLEPFGNGNRRPVFHCRGLRLRRAPQPLGGGEHLRFAFAAPAAGGALGREFICFRGGQAWRRWLAGGLDPCEQRWEILFRLSRSNWRPRSGPADPVQQQLVDLRLDGSCVNG